MVLDVVKARGYLDGTTPMPDPNVNLDVADIWEFNDSFIKVLISIHIEESEWVHTNNCETSYEMWNSLRKFHQLSTHQIFTNKVHVLQNIKEHLIQLKKQWEQVQQFRNENNRRRYDDAFLKHQIIVSLPLSWDTFSSVYVQPHVDNDPAQLDPQKCVNNQELIGIISQEYDNQLTCKHGEDSRPPKGKKNRPSLADRISTSDSPQNNSPNDDNCSSRKKHCCHCGRDGHFTHHCHFIGQNKCCTCECYGHDFDNCPQNQSLDLK